MKNNFLYYGTSFLTGYVILSLELLGLRIFAPYFGYSLYVSSSLIGVILLALSLGYSLGGYWGDHGGKKYLISELLFLSGAYLFIIWVFENDILSTFFQYSVITGSLLATLVFFALPMILLASLSPYFIKLLSDEKNHKVGLSAGSVYTVGTMGSLLGTFLTSFWLVPEFGASFSFLTNIVLLFSLSVLWSTVKTTSRVLGIATVFLLFSVGGYNAFLPKDAIAQVDSLYSHLEVADIGNFLGLRVDRRNGLIYSVYPKEGKWQGDYIFYHLFAIPPIINNAKTSILLGLGTGTIPYIHQEFNPNLSITGVEIDPGIVELGNEYFGLKDRTNTKVIVDDVRPFLEKDSSKYDLIEADLFWGSGEIPFYLTTKEFFTLTKEHLSETGILAVNVYDPSKNNIIIRPVMNTIASVYKFTAVVPFRSGSYFIMGSNSPISAEPILAWAKDHTDDARFLQIIDTFTEKITSIQFDPHAEIFTDDRSPIEKLTYKAIFSQK